jgi:PAS domain-containing protein
MGQPLRTLDDPSEALDPASFGDTFDASPEGLAVASHGRILRVNPAFASLFAYSGPTELAGRSLADFRMDADSRECIRRNGGDAARISNGNPLCDFMGTGAALLDKVRQILDASASSNSTKSEKGKRDQP